MNRRIRVIQGRRTNGAVARSLSGLAAFMGAVVLVTACGSGPAAPGGAVTLVLGAYTTPREAYAKAVIPAFQIPKSTILIENPVALVDVNVDKHGVRPVAEAFVEFLSGSVAQRAYVTYGLRPLDPKVAGESNTTFPPVTDLWKIDFLGGWPKVSKDIFGPEGVFTKTLASIHATK